MASASSPASVPIKRSADEIEGDEIEGAGAGAAKRASPTSVVVLIITVVSDCHQQCFKACVEARDDADATDLERQCAGMRARGVRNVLVRLGEEASDLDGLPDADVLALVKRVRYCEDEKNCWEEMDAIGPDFLVVREIPEGYMVRINAEAHTARFNEPAIVPLEQFGDAHVVCINLVEMAS
jgi:hypothetical protein